ICHPAYFQRRGNSGPNFQHVPTARARDALASPVGFAPGSSLPEIGAKSGWLGPDGRDGNHGGYDDDHQTARGRPITRTLYGNENLRPGELLWHADHEPVPE